MIRSTRSRSSAVAASARRSPPRCARAAVAVTGPLGRGTLRPPRRRTSSCCASPTPRSPPPRPRSRRATGLLVGHCSGATTLDALAPPRGLLAAPADDRHRARRRASPAPAPRSPGAPPRALAAAAARSPPTLGMRPVHVADEDRAAYHAAASIASNFLVTLEGAAERLAATAGVAARGARRRSSARRVENWAAHGAGRALTGPIARGDEATVARQRAAVAERTPELPRALRRARRRRHARARGSVRRGGAHEDRAHRRRAARRAAPARAARAHDRPRPDDGRAARRPPLADPPRARAAATSSSSRCSSTRRSSTSPPTSPPTRATRRATPRSPPRPAPTSSSRRPSRRSTRPASRPRSASPGSPSTLEGAHRGAAHFDGVATVVTKLLQHGRARRRLLRPEGRPAGRRHPPARARPRHPRAIEVGRPSASPTASRCRAATSPARRRPSAPPRCRAR